MPTYGLTSTGFVRKPLEVIRAEKNAALRAAFGLSQDLSDGTIEGQLVGILSKSESDLWELAEAVNSSQDPDQASGAQLVGLAAITGTTPEAEAPSTVDLTMTGDAGTVVPSGSRVSTESTGSEFETAEDSAAFATATVWVPTTSYNTLGVFRRNVNRIYVLITAGVSAGSGGPTTTDDDITDGTAHWRYVGEGTAYADGVAAESVENGPIVALSGDLTEIETPISGWNSVRNLLDADLGRIEESDAELRIRREEELASGGVTPIDALRADLLKVDNVNAVTVFMNVTDTTDGDGLPPHSVEALVQGGEDQDIWDRLLASVATGIQTYGTEVGTATDSKDNVWTMKFSRPDEIEIYIEVDVEYDREEFPIDGVDQIIAAIIAHGDAYPTGRNVRASAIMSAVHEVLGVLGVTAIRIGTAPNPTLDSPIAISNRELATFDTSRIEVTATEATP